MESKSSQETELFILGKGQAIAEFIGKSPTMKFDIDEQGAVLKIILSEDMLDKIKLGGHYDFYMTRVNDTVFICFKTENSVWSSAPYTPHLSKNFEIIKYEEGEGMPLTIIEVCNKDGVIINMELLGLGNVFSNELMLQCSQILNHQWNPDYHNSTINAVYDRFPTDDELVENTDGICYSTD